MGFQIGHEPEGFRRAVQKLPTRFYADGSLLVSTSTARLQESLDILTGLFDSVVLCTKFP